MTIFYSIWRSNDQSQFLNHGEKELWDKNKKFLIWYQSSIFKNNRSIMLKLFIDAGV